jgi:hypothetical protein
MDTSLHGHFSSPGVVKTGKGERTNNNTNAALALQMHGQTIGTGNKAREKYTVK